ncbi:MAG: hypothetical protein ACK5JC_06075 [Bacteroidota bacterium]|jgi:hypothetical protein
MWKDVFLTIVIAFVVFRIMGEFSRRRNSNQGSGNSGENQKNKQPPDDGEYIDYEEIK